MFHYFQFRCDEFLAHYHKRSNVESTFSMIKAKFGDHLRSYDAQMSEVVHAMKDEDFVDRCLLPEVIPPARSNVRRMQAARSAHAFYYAHLAPAAGEEDQSRAPGAALHRAQTPSI